MSAIFSPPFALSLSKCSLCLAVVKKGKGFDELSPSGFGVGGVDV